MCMHAGSSKTSKFAAANLLTFERREVERHPELAVRVHDWPSLKSAECPALATCYHRKLRLIALKQQKLQVFNFCRVWTSFAATTEHSKAEQSSTGQHRTEQSSTEQQRAAQSNTEPHRAEQSSTEQEVNKRRNFSLSLPSLLLASCFCPLLFFSFFSLFLLLSSLLRLSLPSLLLSFRLLVIPSRFY